MITRRDFLKFGVLLLGALALPKAPAGEDVPAPVAEEPIEDEFDYIITTGGTEPIFEAVWIAPDGSWEIVREPVAPLGFSLSPHISDDSL